MFKKTIFDLWIDMKIDQQLLIDSQLSKFYTHTFWCPPDPAPIMPRFNYPPRPRARSVPITTAHPDLPPGKVAFGRGPGTFHARLRLRALGGRWDPNLLGGVWLVPEAAAAEAQAWIELADKARADLPLDDSVAAPAELTTTLRCFMCGVAYPLAVFRARKGARPQDWFCGDLCATVAHGPPSRVQSRR